MSLGQSAAQNGATVSLEPGTLQVLLPGEDVVASQVMAGSNPIVNEPRRLCAWL